MNVRWLITALVIAVLGGSAFIATTAAASRDCFDGGPNGEIICLPILVEIDYCRGCPDPVTERLRMPVEHILRDEGFRDLRATLDNPAAKPVLLIDQNTGRTYAIDGPTITQLPGRAEIQGGFR